jgi:hypothetical protein
MAQSKQPRAPAGSASKVALQRHIAALRNFSAGLMVLSEIAPDRLSVAQGSFFLLAGLADQAGKAVTYTDLKEALGDVINRSLHTTYRVFLDEGRTRGDCREAGLGWLTRETDPKDNRRRYLKLTPAGRAILEEVGAALAPMNKE